MRRIIGTLMLLGFFAGVFVCMAKLYGWKDAGRIFLIAFGLAAFVSAACWLITGGE